MSQGKTMVLNFFYYSTFSGGGSRCQNALFLLRHHLSLALAGWLPGNYMAPVSLIAVEIKISLNTTAANVAQHNTIEKFHLNFLLTKLTI